MKANTSLYDIYYIYTHTVYKYVCDFIHIHFVYIDVTFLKDNQKFKCQVEVVNFDDEAIGENVQGASAAELAQ